MKKNKIKSTPYGRLSIGEEEFNRRVLEATNAVVPDTVAYTLDSLVSEVRPLQGQGLKKPSTEI